MGDCCHSTRPGLQYISSTNGGNSKTLQSPLFPPQMNDRLLLLRIKNSYSVAYNIDPMYNKILLSVGGMTKTGCYASQVS